MTGLSLLRTEIHEGSVWPLLRGVVRRRVPAADVDDVVQATLCDAMGAGRIPERRDDLRRWLVGIARHKATDHIRRICREAALEADDVSAPAPPTDVIILLKNAIADAAQQPAMRSTMELALREADGESYAELARSGAATEVALRQRVSRFRRSMAVRWLAAAAVVGLLAMHAAWSCRHRPRAILPDVDVATQIALRPVEGTWELVAWSGAESIHAVDVEVRAGTVRVLTPAAEYLFAASAIEPQGEASTLWHLWSPSSGNATILVEEHGDTATVTIRDGRWAGTGKLVRRSAAPGNPGDQR
ncbi:sigma-70 family RNA polymerase sigma factor [Pendulispora rubella]|uniref:Sigma-70 family RNA polymerase sigma factor n=1 Tax=Pendulispora rubella TaxID=2741070 RepID=A0ABZ2LKV6_9BACT